MDGNGRRVLITGGSRGLGFAAATKLAQRGFAIVLTSRTAARAEVAAERIRAAVANADVRGMALDLSSLAAVRAFVQRFAQATPALHVVIANAATQPTKQPQRTVDGYEMAWATNHLGHFLLVTELVPLLERGVAETGEARVVVVSSRLHMPGSMGPQVRFDWNDLDLQHNYHPMRAYKNSKLANIWFAYELNRRVEQRGITANALCPNFVPETIADEASGVRRVLYKYVLSLLPFAHSLDEATNTYVYVATDPALRGVGGKFFGEGRPIASSPESYDLAKAARLWQVSEQLTAV